MHPPSVALALAPAISTTFQFSTKSTPVFSAIALFFFHSLVIVEMPLSRTFIIEHYSQRMILHSVALGEQRSSK
jgi:hypothetical protein